MTKYKTVQITEEAYQRLRAIWINNDANKTQKQIVSELIMGVKI